MRLWGEARKTVSVPDVNTCLDEMKLSIQFHPRATYSDLPSAKGAVPGLPVWFMEWGADDFVNITGKVDPALKL